MFNSTKVRIHNLLFGVLGGIIFSLVIGIGFPHLAYSQETITKIKPLVSSKYYTLNELTLSSGTIIEENIINGPPTPPLGFDVQRQSVSLPTPDIAAGTNVLPVPGFSWVFGCSAVSGAMIAGYYDRTGYPNMYTGPANGGVMPLNNSTTYWPTWSDGYTTYPNCPLIASKNGVDGRVVKGSIDDYWVKYDSTADDPYITGAWAQHTWGTAIGDYMYTSQSANGNTDGSTMFYNYSSATPLSCSTMASGGYKDGTLGRKLFYEARGYTVTDCYNQKTDNQYAGGFSFTQFKAEIDAGRPVLLNLAGHSIVGVGYDDSTNTVYIHDTWDYNNHTMTWGGSYSGMDLLSVSIVNLSPVTTTKTLTVSKNGTGTGTVTSSPAGISCGGTCSASFASPSSVTLTAAADSNAVFSGWSGGGCSGTGSCTVSLTDDTTVTATFAQATSVLTQNFDGVTPAALPAGWTSSVITTDGAWATNAGTSNPSGIPAHSSPNLVYFNSYYVSSGYSAALISPVFSLAGTTGNMVSFWMYRDSEYAAYTDRVEVYVNTAASLSGATLLGTINRSTALDPVVGTDAWYSYSFSIPDTFTGATNYLILKGISDWGNDVHIDDISIAGTPVVVTQKTLTVNHAYTSAGTVNGGGSITGSGGISCSSVNGGAKTGTCSALFNSGDTVTLTAAPDANSTFTSWSGGGCSTGGCSFTISADTTVTGTFAGAYKAKISGGAGYDTLTLAQSNAGDNAIILARELFDTTATTVVPFTENLTITKPLVLKGGYDAGFSSNTGLYSTLSGLLTISGGSLSVENLVIK